MRSVGLVLVLVVSTAAFVRHSGSKGLHVHEKPRIRNHATSSVHRFGLGTHSSDIEVPPPVPVCILPAEKPLQSYLETTDATDASAFSILCWNILLPNSPEGSNWWNHKMYAPWVPQSAREWPHRHTLIQSRILRADADIVCLQEADGDTFDDDFGFMAEAGYQHVLHKKFRYRCVTFFKGEKFEIVQASHQDRTLVTSLSVRSKGHKNGDGIGRMLNVVNCHLSAGAAPERRLRQVHDALEQIRKWTNKATLTLEKQRNANRPSPKNIQKAEDAQTQHVDAGTIVCGDFNSDGNTAVRKLLIENLLEPEWREPQYPHVQLTSKQRRHSHTLVDAAELAYGTNVCDGDYGENFLQTSTTSARWPTYVVPNLASLLLLPLEDDAGTQLPRTQFGPQVAKGLAETLDLAEYCEFEMDRAFESIDQDGNGCIDQSEIQALLESAYVATYGRQIEEERDKFFTGFQSVTVDNPNAESLWGSFTSSTNSASLIDNPNDSTNTSNQTSITELTREQISEKLILVQQELIAATNSEAGVSVNTTAQGLADILGLVNFGKQEIDEAFDRMDLDGNNLIDVNEIQTLVESAYLSIYGPKIEEQRTRFFRGFQSQTNTAPTDPGNTLPTQSSLTREQFTEQLWALQQELEGGTEGSELAEVRTEADAQRMIRRFSPLLRTALDDIFTHFSTDEPNGSTLTPEQVDQFLIQTNGALGRGGTHIHTDAYFRRKQKASQPVVLTRQDWYGVFARELGDGNWWQVVHDLEACGATIRSPKRTTKNVDSSSASSTYNRQHYHAWLDYLYFDSQHLVCTGLQEALTAQELSRIYDDGDALPNEWHPSDHLPVAALFSWQ